MNIVLITADNLEHVYVANKLAAEIPLKAIVVDHGRPVSFIANLRRLYRKYTFAQLTSRAHMALMTKIWRDDLVGRRSMIAAYGPENCLEFSCPALLRHIHGINTAEGLTVVSSLAPDIMLIYGTVLVGSKILSLARRVALNMHTGISPYYRGADCAFWPLHNEELDRIGATVHECTRDIDGGRIFGIQKAKLHADDDVFSVFSRSVIAGAELYAKTVCKLMAEKIQGTPQDLSLGREYRAYMRNVRAERKVRRAVKKGSIRRYVDHLTVDVEQSACSGS